MKSNLRQIQPYSNNSHEGLDYRKKYYFHHWINKTEALIEDEEGKTLIVKYTEY